MARKILNINRNSKSENRNSGFKYIATDTTNISVVLPNRQTINTTVEANASVNNFLMTLRNFIYENEKIDHTKFIDPNKIFILTNALGKELDLNKTFNDLKVVDAEKFFLKQSDREHRFEPLIEDVAEAIVYEEEKLFQKWTRFASVWVGTLAYLLAAPIAVIAALNYSKKDTYGYVAILVIFTLGVIFCIRLAKSFIKKSPRRYPGLSRAVLILGYSLTSGITILFNDTYYRLAIFSFLLIFLALFLKEYIDGLIDIHFAAISFGIILLLATGLYTIINGDDLSILPGSLILVSACLLPIIPRIALTLGGISMPFLPGVGEDFSNESLIEKGQPSIGKLAEDIVNQKNSVYKSMMILRGTTGGLYLAGSIGVYLGYTISDFKWCIFILSYIFIVFFRARADVDLVLQFLGIGSAFVNLIIISVVSSFQNANIFSEQIIKALTICITISIVLIYGYTELKDITIKSPQIRRYLELLNSVLTLTIVILFIVNIDLYGLIRG